MKFTDPIAQTYYDTIILGEMAQHIGDMPDEKSYMSKLEVRKAHYAEMKTYPVHNDFGNGIVCHKNINGDVTEYRTVDDNTKEFVHFSHIKKVDASHPDSDLPFDYECQVETEKYKESNLPRGYVEDLVYNHFLKSEHPLKSDKTQYTGGINLWKRLAKRALNDGHHVYLYDNNELHKANHDNIDDLIGRYHGKRGSFMFKHLILSKKEIS